MYCTKMIVTIAPPVDPGLASLQLFTGEAHEPFHWEGGRPAALFIHGFLGTPAEMRPLADALYAKGWTVEGLLLPGFGSEIDTLFSRRWSEWTGTVHRAARELKKHHEPLLLVGYSMGAAVAIHVAAQMPVDGLVLIAPFWQIGAGWQRGIWQIVRRLLPHFQPFKKANFSDPRLQEFFQRMMPGIELTDPLVQEAVRQLRIPTSFVDQVLDLGKIAAQKAPEIATPVHIIQGTADETVRRAQTLRLLQAFPGPLTYEEVDAAHEIVEPGKRGFERLVQSLRAYAQRMAAAKSAYVPI